MTIKTIIRLINDGVMVFDAEGEEIPDYQGRYEEVREVVLREATPNTAFFHWFDCADEPESVSSMSW